MAAEQPGPADPVPTQTAVIVAIPAAEPVVAEHRLLLDQAAGWGVPAHVTVLYPFVEPAALDQGVLADLEAAVAAVDAFDVAFTRTAWFDQEVLWLSPEPAGPFLDLTAAVVAAFPQHPPYAGVHDGSSPHLTVGERRRADLAALRRAERAVRAGLPVTAHVDHALLIAGSSAPGSWRLLAPLPLGG